MFFTNLSQISEISTTSEDILPKTFGNSVVQKEDMFVRCIPHSVIDSSRTELQVLRVFLLCERVCLRQKIMTEGGMHSRQNWCHTGVDGYWFMFSKTLPFKPRKMFVCCSVKISICHTSRLHERGLKELSAYLSLRYDYFFFVLKIKATQTHSGNATWKLRSVSLAD